MKVIGLTLAQVHDIAAKVGVRVATRNNYGSAPSEKVRRDGKPESRFTLRAVYFNGYPVPYRRLSIPYRGKERTISGILCWHGHRDFMREMFAQYPEAVLESAIAKYEGREGFERDYPETGRTVVGRTERGTVEMEDVCFCDRAGYDSRGIAV
jgi:hypothetical protein